MATHSSILAYRVLWMEEPGGLLSMGSHRVGHNWSDLACMHAWGKEVSAHSSVLAWRIPGTEESGGLPNMGSHRVGHDWSNLAASVTKPPPLASFCQSNHSYIELPTQYCRHSSLLALSLTHTRTHKHTHIHIYVVLAQVASTAYHRLGSLKTETTFITVWRLAVQAQVSAVWVSSASSLSACRRGLS